MRRHYQKIDNHFEMTRVEINNQHLYNAVLDERIKSLEVTTQSIDSKVDKVIDHLKATLTSIQNSRKLHTHHSLNSSLILNHQLNTNHEIDI
jgi:hypothetical protein